MLLKKIEELNKTIESLMVKKTKADAQKEVWENRLNESIQHYKDEYGVDISGKSFSEVKSKLAEEIKKVENQTTEEYEKAQKIVSLIQNGDIRGAWRELGVDLDAKAEEEEVAETVLEDEGSDEQEELHGVSEVFEELEDLDNLGDEDFYGSEDSGDIYVEEDDEDEEDAEGGLESFLGGSSGGMVGVSEKVEEPTPAPAAVVKPPVRQPIMWDDDDDDFVTQPSVEVKPEKKAQNSAKPVKESVAKKPTVGISFDDDSDDDDLFGGFGDILSGSKFKVD